MKKMNHPLWTRVTALLLALVCVLGLLPATALAASDTIKLERFGMSGVSYESAALGRCSLHEMYFSGGNKTSVGFCGTKGGGMGSSLIGQTWGNKTPVSDPTVLTMMAYYYAHSTGVFTDEAKALGVDNIWDGGYTWYMNAWVQAVIWRYQQGNMGDPAVACAEELMAVFNSLEGTHYTSIDEEKDGRSFRDRAQYILDLGQQGVWGECTAYEYGFTGAGSSAHPASSVQKIILGELEVKTKDTYTLIVKKVDSKNPTKGLSGAKFHIESESGSFSKDVTTGSNGTATLEKLTPGTYAVTETDPPAEYEIDNAGPEYVVLPGNGNNILTQNLRMSLNGRKHQRNLLQIVVGGSGAGKTRYVVKPNLYEANASYIATDPKGELARSAVPLLLREGYTIRVIDLVDPEHSDCYNPFHYIRNDADVLKLIANFIRNTTPKNAHSNDPFWEKSEIALDSALMLYLLHEAPPEEQTMEMMLTMLEYGAAKEGDGDYQSPLDLLFEALEEENPNHIALRQYKVFKQAPILIHHVNKLKRLKGKDIYERKMLEIRRKTLALCPNCYLDCHNC